RGAAGGPRPEGPAGGGRRPDLAAAGAPAGGAAAPPSLPSHPPARPMIDRHITVCPDPADGALRQTLANVDRVRPVAGLTQLRALIEELGARGARTLDLVAHAEAPTGLLRLGHSLIAIGRGDGEALLPRLGAHPLPPPPRPPP